VVPPAFVAMGDLGLRCNGRSRLSYDSVLRVSLREQPAFDTGCTGGKGEVDFAACPAVSH
jgi:hypothetical protein